MAMDDHIPQLPSVQYEDSRRLPTSQQATALALTKAQFAVQMGRLKAVFGYEEASWMAVIPTYFEALGDIPADLLAEAVHRYIQMADESTRFPKPGSLRVLIAGELDRRSNRERAEDPEWPEWLAALWGPKETGMADRDKAGRQREESYQLAEAARNTSERRFSL